jgi:hypothetical protein
MEIYFFSSPHKRKETPTHKTAHLQIAQAKTRPKFAKELFFSTHREKLLTF